MSNNRLLYFSCAWLLVGVLLGGIAWWASQAYRADKVYVTLWQTQFTDLQGRIKKLSKPNKRPLMINFWATWCQPCREEMSDLAALARALQGKVDFVGIAVDNATEVHQFLTNTPVPYPILLGQADVIALMRAEGNTVGGLPFTVIYAANGQQVMAKAGKIQKALLAQSLHSAINDTN